MNRMQTSHLQQWLLRPWQSPGLAWPSQDQLGSQLSLCHWLPWLLLQLPWLLTWDLGPLQGLPWQLPWPSRAPSSCNSFLSLHLFRQAGLAPPLPTQPLSWLHHEPSGHSCSLQVTTLLDGIQYRHHVHEKGLSSPILVPHRKVEGRVFLRRSLIWRFLNLATSFWTSSFLGM